MIKIYDNSFNKKRIEVFFLIYLVIFLFHSLSIVYIVSTKPTSQVQALQYIEDNYPKENTILLLYGERKHARYYTEGYTIYVGQDYPQDILYDDNKTILISQDVYDDFEFKENLTKEKIFYRDPLVHRKDTYTIIYKYERS